MASSLPAGQGSFPAIQTPLGCEQIEAMGCIFLASCLFITTEHRTWHAISTSVMKLILQGCCSMDFPHLGFLLSCIYSSPTYCRTILFKHFSSVLENQTMKKQLPSEEGLCLYGDDSPVGAWNKFYLENAFGKPTLDSWHPPYPVLRSPAQSSPHLPPPTANNCSPTQLSFQHPLREKLPVHLTEEHVSGILGRVWESSAHMDWKNPNNQRGA